MKFKEKEGITLIALVVTIIVLMILAGVSINLLFSQYGIVTRAKEAAELQKQAQINEQIALEEVSEKIDEIIGGGNSTGELLADKVNIGDYVAYDATNNYSYTSPEGTGPSHGSGYYTSQTFTSNSNIKWRVLSTNTTTKEVVLISEEPIKTDNGDKFSMYGPIGYLYAEQELNEICKIYGHGIGANTSKTFNYETGDLIEGTDIGTITGSGARSLNVDDINKITGYTPTIGEAYTRSIYYPTKTTTTGRSETAANRTDIKTYYYYKGSTYLTDTTSEIYKMLFKNMEDSNYIEYWLASRSQNPDTGSCYFLGRQVLCDEVSLAYLFDGNTRESSGTCVSVGVRPIVYLKSTVKTNGKDANDAWIIIDK